MSHRSFSFAHSALTTLSACVALGGIALGALPARAQTDPDIRNIRPVVMLLVDTSGSMERMPGTASAATPVCAGSSAGTNEHNRWSTLLEALTGNWNNYYCTSMDRSGGSFIGQPDYRFYLPYHQPPLGEPQQNDGILDVYMDRVKFGLMTFDPLYTFTDSNPWLVSRTMFLSRLADNSSAQGAYSYGEQRALTFPGCATTFMVDSGARNPNSPAGALISVGAETDDHRTINQRIQNQLLASRPYGSTQTAALLDDFRYYLGNHPDVAQGSDPYASCRDRYAILITDGQPTDDFRGSRFNCDAVGGCPYQLPASIAGELCQFSSSSTACTGTLDGLFVVGFSVDDPAAVVTLNDIADAGGTGAALLAANRTELINRLAEVLDRAAPGTTTRSRPAFVTSGNTFSSDATSQYELNAGFRMGESGAPWTGVLERRRYQCNASLVPEAQEVQAQDRFHELLNARTTARRLLTVVTPNANQMTGNLVGADASSVPLGAGSPSGVVRNLTLTDLTRGNTALSPAHFGISTGSTTDRANRKNAIVDWLHGVDGTVRRNARLGDIYHSSPVAVTAPRADIADESYNLFRRRPGVADRPTVIYVGTNDGILHAFAAEDHTGTGGTVRAGDELWGFVPPVLVPKLESATASHQIMLDGTPVVRDVFYRRLPGQQPSGDLYHTVLIMGFRAGAPGYFALDVTDPFNPEFLWQFTGETGGSATPLGYSYGRPAIGQVLVDVGGVLQERAVALLPGGAGSVDDTRARTTGPIGCPAQGVGQPPVTRGTVNARSHQRCWDRTGRILTWVDMVTGELIRSFDYRMFNAPLTGGVSLYPGDTGTVAQRAFLTDADGVMWAVDFSARRPNDWSVRPFHDIFWDDVALAGQPAYDPPVVTTDADGSIVVLQATGDIDRLDGMAPNRVVSLRELRTFVERAVTRSTRPSSTGK